MKLLLIRHGETYANINMQWSGSKDLEITNLTNHGIEQAKLLGKWFMDNKYKPSFVYVSPQKRALDTYSLAGAHWNLKEVVTPLLKETGAGDFEGLTWNEIERLFPTQAQQFEHSRNWDVVNGAETESERRSRASLVLDIILSHSQKTDHIAMFCHANIIQQIISVLLQSPKLWGINMKNTALFEFELQPNKWNDQTRTKFNPTLWRILKFNEHPHLTSEQAGPGNKN
jgi:broad specificity phosphatase PhoE